MQKYVLLLRKTLTVNSAVNAFLSVPPVHLQESHGLTKVDIKISKTLTQYVLIAVADAALHYMLEETR